MDIDAIKTVHITLQEDEAQALYQDLQEQPQSTMSASSRKLREFLGEVLFGEES